MIAYAAIRNVKAIKSEGQIIDIDTISDTVRETQMKVDMEDFRYPDRAKEHPVIRIAQVEILEV